MKKSLKLIDMVFIQMAVGIYTVDTIIQRFAGISMKENGLKDFRTLILLFMEVAVLGIYAIVWQQLLSRYQLSIAYANKAMMLMWSLILSYILFKEQVTPWKIAGVLLVMTGTVILNTDPEAGGDIR